jgi:ankyrin repeat protein
LEKVKALLKDNPNLVFSKDNNGATPLHYAAKRHKDVAELLVMAHKLSHYRIATG